MGRSSRQDPLKVMRFGVSVPGFKRTGFRYCSGLHESTEKSDYREGTMNESARKSAGLTTYDDITLRRGQVVSGTDDPGLDFYVWRMQVASVKTEGYNDFDYRREPTITQYGRDGAEACLWNIAEAWPCEYRAMSDLDALGNDDCVEEIVLANEGWSREGAPAPAARGSSLSASLGI